MKSKIAIGLIALAGTTQAFADNSYKINGVISEPQLNNILKALLKTAPSGTKTSDVQMNGFFTLDDKRYLTGMEVDVIFKVTTKIGFITLMSEYVTLGLGAAFSDLNCGNPQMTRTSVSSKSGILQSQIEDYMKKNRESIIRDNFVAQTDLVKYCKVRPQ